ncbi:MAG: hypothetical protein N0E55_01720 [Candidatus Thiodiazotropha taylori]|nr:hypothetical protein [Candidatus Thiodiazotropha taylori]MCG8105782.1 hypothetical protein [Candidatus Thiodiazotropha taylori]MCG8112036.1 hypothetical protein [Candidatus Thiodiazotropha taylori]MCG8122674.1 hypothetical protein [Candidatus Thiodiazotropha taylori]MCW4251405.1 hypothetical protein [Candidatus Thiodiazotropha taylori]
MGQIIKDYLERICRYHYLGYIRHYYNAARHPHPFRFLAFILLSLIVTFSLAIFCTFAIINNTFQGNSIIFYGLTVFMYFIGFTFVPTIVLWIQGYRHREKILSSEIPDNLPQNSGKEVWYVLMLLSLYQTINKIFE